MPKKNKFRKYNLDNRDCDYCGEFHWAGEMTYLGNIPGRGHTFICSKCELRRNAIQEAKKVKKEREDLKASQPKLF